MAYRVSSKKLRQSISKLNRKIETKYGSIHEAPINWQVRLGELETAYTVAQAYQQTKYEARRGFRIVVTRTLR